MPIPTDVLDRKLMSALRKSIFANAKRLLLDSEILFESGAFPSAVFLAVSSIEEAGKLYDVLVAYHKNKEGKFDAKEFYKRFRDHKLKHLSSFTKASKEEKVSKNISKLWELIADNKLMPIRNNCIYTDIDLKKSVILYPSNCVTQEDAYYFIETAYEVLLSQVDSAFGDFWIDESQDIEIKLMQEEIKILTTRLKALREQKSCK